MFKESDVIFRYTRAQAIEDGVLVDVTERARECGFKCAVAVTANLWADVIVPDEKAKSAGQSESGRLWDLLWMLYVRIVSSPVSTELLFYTVLVHDGLRQRQVQVKAVCGPGDEGELTITVMRPDED